MFSLNEFHRCLSCIAGFLRSCDVRFHLTGGAAAIAYGDPRTTQNLDLVVDRNKLNELKSDFVRHLQQNRFLFHEPTLLAAIEAGKLIQLIDVESTLKLNPYPRELVPGELSRASEIEIMPGLLLPVASRPDLVISKLIWISKGSHKSRRDVRQIMLRSSETDIGLTNALADQMQLRHLLDEVLAETDQIDV